jgi:thiol:disulfide interchange protein DsbD
MFSRCRFLPVVGLLLLGGLVPYAAFGGQTDPFASANELKEPEPKKVVPQPPEPVKESLETRKLAELISLELRVEPKEARPGEVVRAIISGKLKDGYHTYPINKLAPGQISTTKLIYAGDKALQPLWPIEESEPEFHRDVDDEVRLVQADKVSWVQDFYIAPRTSPGTRTIKIQPIVMVCNKGGCFGPGKYRLLTATLEVKAGDAGAPGDALKKRLAAGPPTPQVVPVPASFASKASPSPDSRSPANRQGNKTQRAVDRRNLGDSGESGGLLGLLISAAVGAFLMLLTPCVFPMIPITVNFFLKQSEKEHHNALTTALVYSGTIILLLTTVILIFGKVVIVLANNPIFNLVLGGLLVAFALSLFGMYELALPSGLARFTSAREGQGGYLGAVFMALTFTITSFTCTGPFLGALLAPVAGLQPPLWHLVLAALVYSTTFAAPFFVLALFPTLLKTLPKSGGWLNSIKVTMGFLELAAALKFLSNTDLILTAGNAWFFNYDTVLSAWIALSVACGLYLIGVYRLPHDDKVEKIGTIRMLFAALFLGLAVYMSPLLFGIQPAGVVAEAMVAFLPPSLREGPTGSGSGGTELAWLKDYDAAWEQAVKEKKLIFVDFTALQCPNCRANEKNVFAKGDIQEDLKKYVRVQLYTDSVPNKGADAQRLAALYKSWQEKDVHDLTLPTYVILRPKGGSPRKSDELQADIVAVTGGLIRDVPGFADFLKKPLEQQIAQQAETGKRIAWHRDYEAAWKQAVQENKPMFLYFTGLQDPRSRHVEKNVFSQPAVRDRLANLVPVQLYVDYVPIPGLPPQEASRLAKRHRAWQEEVIQDLTFPCCVVFRPDRHNALKNGQPQGEVVRITGGVIRDVPQFVTFLDK